MCCSNSTNWSASWYTCPRTTRHHRLTSPVAPPGPLEASFNPPLPPYPVSSNPIQIPVSNPNCIMIIIIIFLFLSLCTTWLITHTQTHWFAPILLTFMTSPTDLIRVETTPPQSYNTQMGEADDLSPIYIYVLKSQSPILYWCKWTLSKHNCNNILSSIIIYDSKKTQEPRNVRCVIYILGSFTGHKAYIYTYIYVFTCLIKQSQVNWQQLSEPD